MRKQFHFRPAEPGPLVWDVDRLIALTKDLPRFQLPLASIPEIDEPYWFGGDEVPTCRTVVEHAALIAAADLRFPIILSSTGRVMDGMHRVGKALMMGWTTVEAVRFVVDPEPDFVGLEPEALAYQENAAVATSTA